MAADNRERLIADLQFGAVAGTALVLGGVTYVPATWYLGLSKTTPNEDGTNFTEPVGMSYGRIAVPNNFTSFRLAVTNLGVTTKANAINLKFVDPTGTWGLLTDYGWFTTLTGGIPEYHHPLDTPITVQSGNTPVEFAPDQLEMVWD